MRHFILISLLLSSLIGHSQLNGTYTIDLGGGGDYISFNTAVADLVAQGVSGPVVFEAAAGTYTEQISLLPVTGASATNTITFRSQTLNNADVTLRYQATSSIAASFVVRWYGADHVTFEHMTIQRFGASAVNNKAWVVYYPNLAGIEASQYSRFSNIRFIGDVYLNQWSYSNIIRSANNNNELETTIIDCRFEDGAHAIYWDQNTQDDRLLVQGNEIVSGYSGMWFIDFDHDLTVRQNRVSGISGATNPIAIALSSCNGGFIIEKNLININATVGIYTYNCQATIAAHGVVKNNVVISNGTAANNSGIELYGNCRYLDIFNNSVSLNYGRGYDEACSGGNNIALVNNIFRMNTTGNAIYKNGAATYSALSHNCLYSGGAQLAFWNGNRTDLSSLQLASGGFTNSIQVDPLYINATSDLTLQATSPCLSTGTATINVLDDFNGDPRPAPAPNPDIGAYELNICVPMAGIYTIGPSLAAHYPDFNSAVNHMYECGISGSVVFEVEDGTYNEKISILPVVGTSATNTITFRGISMDNTLTVVSDMASPSATDNYVLSMEGVDFVTFEHIGFHRTNGNNSNVFSRVLDFPQLAGSEASQNVNFKHVRFFAVAHNSASGNRQLVHSSNTNSELYVNFDNCIFDGDFYSMYWSQGAGDDRLTITNSEFTNSYFGMDLLDFDHDLIVSDNWIHELSLQNSTSAISLVSCHGGYSIERNRIRISGRNGIRLNNNQATGGSHGVIKNNMVIVNGSSADDRGIMLFSNCSNIDIWHNSVSNNSGRAYSETCFAGGAISLVNNIFYAGQSGAFSLYSNANISYAQASNLCLYNAVGGDLAYWSGNMIGLGNLQLASGLFTNTISCDPMYFDALNDLHSFSMDVNAAGLSLPAVTDDHDAEVRTANPDIGADEFTPELWTEFLDVCLPTDAVVSTGSAKKQWIYKDRKVVASFNDNGNVLGVVNGFIYINSGPVRTSLIGQYYLDRNWWIDPQYPITGANVDIDLYFHQAEFSLLQTAAPMVNVISDVGISQYDGPNENCQIADNTITGTWYVHYPAPDGTMPEIALTPYRMSTSLTSFSEFYITTFGDPLPVELISFAGRRVDRERILLDWSTATETNNEGFEIWRKIEGESEFEQIGWVNGSGNSLETVQYQFEDPNATDRISYYFLRQVDHNGESENSEIVAVQGNAVPIQITLYPNPARDRIYLQGSDCSGCPFSIVDGSGRIVRTGIYNGNDLDIQGLNKGLYTLKLDIDGAGIIKRFQVL